MVNYFLTPLHVRRVRTGLASTHLGSANRPNRHCATTPSSAVGPHMRQQAPRAPDIRFQLERWSDALVPWRNPAHHPDNDLMAIGFYNKAAGRGCWPRKLYGLPLWLARLQGRLGPAGDRVRVHSDDCSTATRI